MKKYKDIYDVITYGYQLISRLNTVEAERTHVALKSRIYDLFNDSQDEIEFYKELAKNGTRKSKDYYPINKYLEEQGIDSTTSDFGKAFTLFASNEVIEDKAFSGYITGINLEATTSRQKNR